ncbi:extended synaptotagmin-1-like protein [Labeo rohita]|uniref:Extended synaptotagmin-1-like protein n=1 Tax=Labeo rohita TaxID=84645 RepID=A0A498P1N8_LABRO|nr:extended synaptotagmin-1-like protein [Labeo rohita]
MVLFHLRSFSQLHGMMRVILEPLIGDVPIVGAVTMFFIQRPVIVHEVPGQELEVEVFDKDPDHDDFLGRTKLDLGIVKKSKIVDEWFTLVDTSTGRVHLKLEWLTLEANTERLEEVLKRNESVVSKTAKPPSAAILAVYLDKAEALPLKKGNKDPNPIVQVSVEDVTRDSRICWNTVNPQWEDAFTFFIKDPSKQDISIQTLSALSTGVNGAQM